MIAFPFMLFRPAEQAGMKTPTDEEYDPNEFPHFHVFCSMQLGAPMPNPSSHWENAKVIAAIPSDQIKTVTPKDILALGFQIGRSNQR